MHIMLALVLVTLVSNVACEGRRQQSLAARAAPVAPVAAATTTAAAASNLFGDADEDGIPDRAEVRSYGDRENFRRWFTTIAELQFEGASDEWNTAQRDCAGLVRFAWRESLRTHDRAWFRRMGGNYDAVAPDVRAYHLGNSPLGEKLFRTTTGAFKPEDFDGDAFSEYADARTLKDFNSVFISRDRRQAASGDLVFFHQPWVQRYPYHVMIFLGAGREASGGAADWVVYHTGSSPTDAGAVKKARLTTLDQHPDRRWRPVAGNRNFLGFYRLKILK